MILAAVIGFTFSQQAVAVHPQDAIGVKIEVIGVYRDADVAFVREQLKGLLPKDIRNYSWSASGNRFKYTASPVDDVGGLATKIPFGRSVHVDGRRIRVIYRYDNDVPELPVREPKFYEERVEDPLGPALKKHDGDWWAALEELRMTRQRNKQSEITRLDLPSFKTTDETLAHVARLKSLNYLKLTLARHVTDDGARHLAGLTNLETLQLFGSSIGDPGQTHLSNLTKLKWLSLSGRGTEHGLRHVANLTNLESLSIGFGLGYPVTTVGLEHLRKLKNLKNLRLDGCEISDDGLELIAGFPKLESLRLQSGIMTDSGLAHLSTLKHLRRLELNQCENVGESGVAYLAPLTALTFLNLSHTGVTDEGVAHLRPLTNLTYLNLQGTAIADDAVEALQPITELALLYLDQTAISDTALEYLKSFRKLTDLSLSETAVTDAGLKHLSELTRLRSLRIGGTKITDDGLAHLAGLTHLTSLDISDTSVTERGLKYLAHLERLREIRIEDSGVTREELQLFQKRSPRTGN